MGEGWWVQIFSFEFQLFQLEFMSTRACLLDRSFSLLLSERGVQGARPPKGVSRADSM